MPIKIGTSDAAMRLGTASVSRMYLGTSLAYYSSGGGSTPTPSSVPTPIFLRAVAGDATVSLAWVNTAATGVTITGHVVQYSSNNGVSWTGVASGVTSSASAAVTGLSNGTAYIFRVAAQSSSGISNFSAKTTAVTPRGTPGAPTGAVANITGTRVELSWNPPSVTGGVSIDQLTYAMQRSSDGGTTWQYWMSPTASAFATMESLTPGTAYVFRVAAQSGTVLSAFSSASNSITAPTTEPSAPTITSVEVVNGSSGYQYQVAAEPMNGGLAVRWQAPASDGGSAITGYAVYYYENAIYTGAKTLFCTNSPSQLSADITGLTNGTRYCVQVIAVTSAGRSLPAEACGVPAAVPARPTGLSLSGFHRTIRVEWNSVVGASESFYYIEYAIDGTNQWKPFQTLQETPSAIGDRNLWDLVPLANGQAYRVRLAAMNAHGVGPYAYGTATPIAVPSRPTNLAGVAGSGRVTLTWTAPVPSFGNTGAITDYVIQYAAVGGTSWATFSHSSITTPGIAVTGLTAGTGYVFRVAGVNSLGTGPYSATAGTYTPT